MQQTLSANTLFHFTRELEFLKGILRSGIFVRYSLETYGDILDGQDELVLPMACFCDIPLSKIRDHKEKYGCYAIGLSKTWGMRNGLSPVLYAHKDSETAKILNSLEGYLGKIFDISTESDWTGEASHTLVPEEVSLLRMQRLEWLIELNDRTDALSAQLGHFLKYIKPYEGDGYSNGLEVKKNRFYDEKEWRYIPPKELLSKVEVKDVYKRDYYLDPVKRRYINIRLATHKKLIFTPNDIRFIVVQHDSEIPHMIEEITKLFGDSISYHKMRLLTSRLISMEQIIEDL